MAKGGARLVVVMVVVLVVGGVAAFFVTAATTAKKTGVDKKEVQSWAAHWQQARECLLGSDPYATVGPLAVELREAFVADINDAYKDCVVRLEATRRPAGKSSDDKRAEQLWVDVGLAVRKLEKAVRVRIDGHSAKKVSDIGVAVVGVDEQHARLSKAAGLQPPVIAKRVDKLAVLHSKPLRWKGGWVLTERKLRRVGNVLVGMRREVANKRERLYLVRGPGDVDMRERVLDTESRWMVRDLRVKPVAEVGAAAAKKAVTILKVPEQPATPPEPDDTDAGVAKPPEPSHALVYHAGDREYVVVKALPPPVPEFHLDHGDDHIIGFKVDTELFIAESTNAGRTWKQTFRSGDARWTIDSLDWTRLIVKLSNTGKRSYLPITVTDATRDWSPRVIAEGAVFRPGFTACYADPTLVWWLLPTVDGAMVVRDARGAMTVVGNKLTLRTISSCSRANAVALGDRGKRRAAVVVCGDHDCKRAFDVPDFTDGGAVVGPDGHIVAASKDRHIIGVWRNGKRRFYRLPSKGRLFQLAVFDGKVYGLLGYGHKRRLLVIPTDK